MTQSTDTETTQPMATIDPDATVTIPVIAPAVPVPPAPLPFDRDRARALHVHRVLGRILSTPTLAVPTLYDGHLWASTTLNLILLGDADGAKLHAYQEVFGGEQATEERDSYDGDRRMRYDKLTTVIDGIDVVVSAWTELGVIAQPAPVAEASEPEPQHDPAPAPAPETPVEHPEAA